MRKYLCLAFAFLLSIALTAQLIKKENECIGFGKFVLGESMEKFTVVEINGGKYEKDGRKFTTYGTAGPVELLSTTFNSILLTFNDSNKLVLFSFIKFYKRNDSPRYEKEAKKYYEQLYTYISGELNRTGEKKTYYTSKKSRYIGQEWKTPTTLLKLTKSSTAYHSTVQVSFGDPGH